jgi:hypothetical protein
MQDIHHFTAFNRVDNEVDYMQAFTCMSNNRKPISRIRLVVLDRLCEVFISATEHSPKCLMQVPESQRLLPHGAHSRAAVCVYVEQEWEALVSLGDAIDIGRRRVKSKAQSALLNGNKWASACRPFVAGGLRCKARFKVGVDVLVILAVPSIEKSGVQNGSVGSNSRLQTVKSG